MSSSAGIFLTLILPLLLVVTAGYVLDRRMTLDLRTLNRASLYLFVPCLAFSKIYASTIPLRLLGAASGFTALMVVVMLALGWAMGRLMRRPKSVCVAFAAAAAFYNSGNYGLPLIELVFHNNPSATALQAMVAAAQNLLTFTVGIVLIAGGKKTLKESLGAALQYPFVYMLLAAIVCRYLNWTMPSPVLTAIRTLGEALVPVALITLGAQLARIAVGREMSQVIAASAVRMIAGPCVGYLLVRVLGFHGLLAQTVFISSGVPPAVNITILAMEYDTEPDFVAQTTFCATVISAVTMTAVVYIALTYIR